jgi:hypothetical protein
MAPYTVRTKRLDKLWQNPHFGAAGDEIIASGSTDLPYGRLGHGGMARTDTAWAGIAADTGPDT